MSRTEVEEAMIQPPGAIALLAFAEATYAALIGRARDPDEEAERDAIFGRAAQSASSASPEPDSVDHFPITRERFGSPKPRKPAP
jgi:hypothetical protein